MDKHARLLARLEILGFAINGNEASREVIEWDDTGYYPVLYTYGIENNMLVSRFTDGHLDKQSTNAINRELARCHV